MHLKRFIKDNLFSSFVRFLAVVFTLQFALVPLASAKQEERSHKEKIKNFLKVTGFGNSQLTYGNYYQQIKNIFDPRFQKIIQADLKYFNDIKMPKLESSTFVDSAGVEQVRLIFKEDGKSMTLTTGGWGQHSFVQFNNSKLSYSDLYDAQKLFTKLVSENPELFSKKKSTVSNGLKGFALTKEQFKKLPADKKEAYIKLLREAAESVSEVYENYQLDPNYGTNDQVYFNHNEDTVWAWLIFGDYANAAQAQGKQAKKQNVKQGNKQSAKPTKKPSSLDGRYCVVAGHLSTYAESRPGAGDYSCGLGDATVTKGCKSSGSEVSYSCNPIVYGGSYCVSVPKAGSGKRARPLTEKCNSKASKLDVVKSWAKDKNLSVKDIKQGENGSIVVDADDDVYAKLQEYSKQLSDYIDSANSQICSKVDQAIQPPPQALMDQVDACKKLNERLISLEQFKKSEVPSSPVQQNPVADSCVGDDCVRDLKPGIDENKKEDSGFFGGGFWDRFGKGILITLGVFGVLWWLVKRDKNDIKVPQYIPPVPPALPPVASTPTPTAPPIPVVPVPPVVPTTEGGAGTSGTVSGGVR